MKRDLRRFPADENGDVLWQMHLDGDDLAKPREVDFAVVFPSEEGALRFAMHLLQHQQKVSFCSREDDEEMPWQVQAHPTLAPTHDAISGYERQLGEDAAAYDGRNDGWGCMQQS